MVLKPGVISATQSSKPSQTGISSNTYFYWSNTGQDRFGTEPTVVCYTERLGTSI